MAVIDLVLKGALVVLSFYVGFRFSRLQSTSQCSQLASTSLAATPAIAQSSAAVAIRAPTNFNVSTKYYDHCYCGMESGIQTSMELLPATVVDKVFPDLHHPASMARWSILFSRHANNSIDKCNEVYLTRSGSRGNQPNKCVAVAMVPDGVASAEHHSHRYGTTANTFDQYQKDFARDVSFKEEVELLPPILQEIEALRSDFINRMGNPLDSSGQRRSVVVMVANEGVTDLVLNFLCSAEAIDFPMESIAVFVGSEGFKASIEQTGAKAFYSVALGSMPSHAANSYLDKTFSRMMWFKTTSQYLALSSGYNVLFQDVDLVWLKNPIPYLQNLAGDIIFMDDGARTPRYTPFFTNSGFYYIKYNPRSLYFQEKMLKNGPAEIGYTHSHQSVLIKHLAEAHHLIGLRVVVLDKDLFPSGQAYHENKKFVDKVIKRTFRPYVFHMCWTDNRVNKVVYFKEIRLWFVSENEVCNDGKRFIAYGKKEHDSEALRGLCCKRSEYWKKEDAV